MTVNWETDVAKGGDNINPCVLGLRRTGILPRFVKVSNGWFHPGEIGVSYLTYEAFEIWTLR